MERSFLGAYKTDNLKCRFNYRFRGCCQMWNAWYGRVVVAITYFMFAHQNRKEYTRICNILKNCPSSLSCCISKRLTSVCVKKCGWIPEDQQKQKKRLLRRGNEEPNSFSILQPGAGKVKKTIHQMAHRDLTHNQFNHDISRLFLHKFE